MKNAKTTPCKAQALIANRKYAYFNAPRCGAKTRSGSPCKSPAVKGKERCRMHGGAKGSGAPLENQNAFKHGYTTQQEKTKRNRIMTLLKECNELISNNT